jgi:hypothetical protein
MGGRLLFSAGLVTASVAWVSPAVAGAGQIAASMTLDKPDFTQGAVLVSEGPQPLAGIPSFPSSSSYSRSFRNVGLGKAVLIILQSSVSVAKKASDPAAVMSSLILLTRSPAGRKEAAFQVKTSLAKALNPTSVSVLRARVIRSGDSAVDLLFLVHSKTGPLEFGEQWIEVGPALSLTVFATSGAGLTAGDATRLVKLVASHLRAGLEPAPRSTIAPVISGNPQVGQVLTTTAGTWTGTAPEFRYLWLRCNVSSIKCSAIPGATSSSYMVTSADTGSTLVASVKAVTRAGTAEVRSQPTQAVV